MGLRFRKSVKIAPGVKVNVNKKSVSMTAGTKGAHITKSTNGRTTKSAGIPGTCVSYVKTSGGGKKKGKKQKKNGSCLSSILGFFFIVFIIGMIGSCAGNSTNKGTAQTTTPKVETHQGKWQPTNTPTHTPEGTPTPVPPEVVWISDSGSKYHSVSDCSGMEGAVEVAKDEAEEKGYERCGKCKFRGW